MKDNTIPIFDINQLQTVEEMLQALGEDIPTMEEMLEELGEDIPTWEELEKNITK